MDCVYWNVAISCRKFTINANGNINRSLIRKYSVFIGRTNEIYKIFLLRNFSWKIGFSSPVTLVVFPNSDGSFFPTFLFKVDWNVNILLFALRVLCVIHFSCCCWSCWKSSSDVVADVWYNSLGFPIDSPRGSKKDGHRFLRSGEWTLRFGAIHGIYITVSICGDYLSTWLLNLG